MTELLHFRDVVRQIVPPWLSKGLAGKILYAIWVHGCAAVDAAVAAVELRMPGLYSWESMPLIGRDRRIPRGPEETDEGYRARLNDWQEIARRKGSPVAMLRMLRAYLTPHAVTIRHINNAGYRYTITPAGVITIDQITWDWDGDASKWWRFWIVLEVPSEFLTDEGDWGDPGVWGDGGTIGSTATPDQVAGIRRIVSGHAAHAECVNVIVVFSPSAWEAQQPDGTWNVPSHRNPDAIYWTGV